MKMFYQAIKKEGRFVGFARNSSIESLQQKIKNLPSSYKKYGKVFRVIPKKIRMSIMIDI